MVGKVVVLIAIIISAMLIIIVVLWLYCRKRPNLLEDISLETLTNMPIRFSYKELAEATNNFSPSEKLGQGGFGSVYKGNLRRDGTTIAVKKLELEGIGQGEKQFKAEVSSIGSTHHLHLARLRGFCAEGTHRLLAYEYMDNGSLDKWIFKKKKGEVHQLDWNTRYNIALGTAKGLAYLHEECPTKIIHCDIKPGNVLLDHNFNAKVSDFGLAKLINREQSRVYTLPKGTPGYLAPEWIRGHPISEKGDVYSYGMLLLEVIGGRRNYDPEETSEKSYFPTLAFKMMEEGKLRDILDPALTIDGNEYDSRIQLAFEVALCCIQDDASLRPSMTTVVEMLKGLYPVHKPQPPTNYSSGVRLSSSCPPDRNSGDSAVILSGPR